MRQRTVALSLVALAVASSGCMSGEDESASTSSATLEVCSDWRPSWTQANANNWWVEFSITGDVRSAALEVKGRASVPLQLKWGKWGASMPKVERGANVVLRAQDGLGRAAQTRSFAYLVETAPPTATCAAECGAWAPSLSQGAGANEWWVEYAITGGGGTAASATLDVPGRASVVLSLRSTKWAASTAKIPSGTSVVLRAQDTAGNAVRSDSFPYLVERAPKTAGCAPPVDPGAPDGFTGGEVDVVSIVKTAEERRAISPLIYGLNSVHAEGQPAQMMRGVSFVRRGGDRSNTYNWETNISNGSRSNGFKSDAWLVQGFQNPNAPGELDRLLIAGNQAAGRGTMIPFVLNDYVAGPVASNIPWDQPGWNVNQYFRRAELVKPTAFVTTPDLNDGVVYTDEHLNFLKRSSSADIFAPGPTQLMVGTDNEPDLYAENLPFLQRGSGRPLYAPNGVEVGRYVTGDEFTARLIRFAKRVKSLWPTAPIVGPDHYHFDGYTTWWGSMTDRYSDGGRWYMDDFLTSTRQASEAAGRRLLDTWDFHWYPQRVFAGTYTWALDHTKRSMTQAEIDAVVQGPRSYWDTEYDEQSWITNDHLHAPAYILTRLKTRIEAAYPGTKIGVTEYFPGGCGHVSSALGVADTLGVFGRMGVHIAAMWPHSCDLRWAFGGFQLVRNADGNGLRFAATSVKVEHPEKVSSSVYAASDDTKRVTVLVVNKTNAQRKVGLRLFHSARLGTVDTYRVDAAHPAPFRVGSEAMAKNNAYAYAAPPLSATLLVFNAP